MLFVQVEPQQNASSFSATSHNSTNNRPWLGRKTWKTSEINVRNKFSGTFSEAEQEYRDAFSFKIKIGSGVHGIFFFYFFRKPTLFCDLE